jgi:hypothetical protein
MQERNDPYIEKMAIVGDKRWEDLALMFAAKGLGPFPIRPAGPSRRENRTCGSPGRVCRAF